MLRSRGRLIGVAVLSALTSGSGLLAAQPTALPTESDLAGARKLFAEALHDEEHARFAEALDKFRHVREVRDTAQVEYHVAVCLEGLGRLADAWASYTAAARLSEGDRAALDVADGSRERLDALSRRVGHLTVTPSSRAPGNVELRVDGQPASTSGDIVLDPGNHHVEARAPGVPPFLSDVTLPEGGRVSLTLSLDPPPAASTTPTGEEPAHPLEEHGHGDAMAMGTASSSTRAWGWVTLGTGAALVVGSVASLLLRESDIRRINRDCPGGGCVGSIPSEAQSAADRARIEGPVGWTLGAAGLVAAGVGAYLVLHGTAHSSGWALVPEPLLAGAELTVRGSL